ncbi:AraC family transcriptional regulator [Cytophagaceae bacterium DM2B3-1]|uniref:AraC family transcriptional regulator n=1 Tax=Xanthocytophaga flava TaxID=3048013 RepID=A0ABT7CGA5_9BACT|nr:AraC family transcriptional regulator [Xanthocytophaga flavus]MDJ1468908.1 AraC family transcriptional regulator [Xanthocytophaga flavus]MDJ1492082.1 AraC family transcriptional regulator [Xanthocytophaga flavus]
MNQEETYYQRLFQAVEQHPESIYVLHEKLEYNFPIHKHDKGQLSYVEGGMAYLYTKEATYFLPARHYAWIPAGVEHRLFHSSPSQIDRNIYFVNQNDLEHPFFGKLGIYPVTNLLLEMILFTEAWTGNLIPEGFPYQFLITLKLVLPEVSRHPLPLSLPTTESKRLDPIIQYIHKNLSESLTLSLVADQFGYSVRSLSRLFQQNLSVSFLQYLKLCRMIKAMVYLLETDKRISEIAYQTGYNSLSAFSNTFYELVHMRPMDFRSSVKR